jgi:hypothetical protein
MPLEIRFVPPPPPSNVSPQPDKDTQKGMDQTGPNADGRVLYINLWLFKYGTDDKTHAAAVVFSFVLLIMIASIIIGGMVIVTQENPARLAWVEKVFSWSGSAFLFIAGIALGSRGVGSSKSNSSNEDS